MNGFWRSTVVSIVGSIGLTAALFVSANVSSISAAYAAPLPSVPTDTTRAPIPDMPSEGNGDSGFILIPGVFLLFDPTQRDSVRTEFKSAEKKEFYWVGFEDIELASKKATKSSNGRILVARYGDATPAYEFDRADGTYVASITKIPLSRTELIAVLYALKSRLKANNNFEHIDIASETKPAEISNEVGAVLQGDMSKEFANQIRAERNFSLVVFAQKSNQSKSIEKTARKAAKRIKSDRPDVLFVNTRDWLNQNVLSCLEVKGPPEGVTYLVVDRQGKIVGRREAPAASVDDLVEFFNESIAGARAQ